MLSAIDSVSDESLTEVVFASDDVRESYQEMADRGVPFQTGLKLVMSREGSDLLGASFQDPDGHYGTLQGWVDSE